MKIVECDQGSLEWYEARAGRVTASGMENIITPTGKASTAADKYMNKILAELITGAPSESWKGNEHSQRGHEAEDEAAQLYAMSREVELTRVGFCVTDLGTVGCSPDRFVGDDGMLEIKTALSHIVVEYILSGKLEQEHRPQTQCGLFVTDRKWVDTMLYNPLMKPIIIRSYRDESYICNMCLYLDNFFRKLEAKKVLLRQRGYLP